KQIAIGLLNYTVAHPKNANTPQKLTQFPAGTVPNVSLQPGERLSWLVEVLPYVEHGSLYRRMDRSARWDAAVHAPVVQTHLDEFWCRDWARESSPPLT